MTLPTSDQLKNVILVDENDNEIGTAEKLAAHTSAQLHRAFSIFIFNTKGQMLIQRRALDKYHSGGLWSNTCCSHPAPGETTLDAGKRRLQEEMAMACPLHEAFSFEYRHDFENGLTEHELDHVLIGTTDQDPTPAPEEAMDWKHIDSDELLADTKAHPEKYSVWFLKVVERVLTLKQTRKI